MSGRPVHEILWRAAGDLITPDCNTPLPALLLTHAAFEAFINHLGERVAPEVWGDERSRFTTTPHRGVLGKLNWLCEISGVTQDWGSEPWQSLKSLDRWRNRLAHGKLDGDGLEACTAVRVCDQRAAVRDVCGWLWDAATVDRGNRPFAD